MPANPRCQILPLPDDQTALSIDGRELTRWHFGDQSPRPFFYPLFGPTSGASLTRMGHPGAPNHDHHRSVWFAHHKLLGINFWGDQTDARIRQQEWLVYEDGEEECGLAVKLGWYDGHDPQPLIEQELIAFLRPLSGTISEDGYLLDLQSTFTPTAKEIELQQTNFGFLAVRVAKSLSAHFGGGHLTGSDGQVGEPALFGKPNAWMDYSGSMSITSPDGPAEVIEGITFFDHPDNLSYPSKWHVRDDGWMGASVCRDQSVVITKADSLRLRYLLHVHSGPVDADKATAIAADWVMRPPCRVIRATKKHYHYEIERLS